MQNMWLCHLICCVLLSTTFAQTDELLMVNQLLQADVNLVGPGVLARLTPIGTAYVSSVVARALTTQVPIAKLPNEPKTTTLDALNSVEFSEMHLNLFEIPNTFNIAPQTPNAIFVELRNVNLSVSTHGSGNIDGIPMDTQLDIRTSAFTLDVQIKIGKNQNGNPHLKVESCSVPAKIPVVVAVKKALTPETGSKLANAIAVEGHTIYERIICPRLTYIIENRVNQRFGLLSSKISLGETHNFDLVRSILHAQELQKRAIRQENRMPTQTSSFAVRDHRMNIAARPARMNRPSMSRNVRQGNVMWGGQAPSNMHRMPEQEQVLMQRRAAALERLMVRSPRQTHSGDVQKAKETIQRRVVRQDQFHTFLNQFNLSRADSLILNYAMLSAPIISERGIELETSGEIKDANGRTPFGPHKLLLPATPSTDMLQLVVSDYVPNTLMYHGHRTGLFNTRVDPSTPQFGPVMRTSCDLSTGALFCVGDLFPTLREQIPDRGVVFRFSTLRAPAIQVHPENRGGIIFNLVGLIDIAAIEGPAEVRIGSMEIHIDAKMSMRLSSKSVKGRVNLQNIKLITRAPHILVQEELDDAGFLSREILQRMVNDILKQGIPIPVHPLFKLQKPKMTLMERQMLLETSFQLNENLIRQLTSEQLLAQ